MSCSASVTRLCIGVCVALVLAACGTAPVATASDEAQSFEQASAQAADALARQVQTQGGLWGRFSTRQLVLDPTLDAGTGQQTAATHKLDAAIAQRLARDGDRIEVLPFQPANLARAQYLVASTLAREDGAFRLNLALVDLKSGAALAHASAKARAEGVDMNPLAYWRDSPVRIKDKVIDGYVRTSATAPGGRADAGYIERIAAAALIHDATALYNAERYQEALGQYRSALTTPAGDQIRVLNGIYLSTVKLGRMAEAEEAFGRLVAFGIGYSELGVKLLFNPGGTEFWADPKISSVYGMWLRQIARESATAKACMDVVGHTSKTGSQAYNDALSLRRAHYVRQRLGAESADVASRIRVQGVGWRQNIVGSGTDDGVDALDRRVEFKIVPCSGGVAVDQGLTPPQPAA